MQPILVCMDIDWTMQDGVDLRKQHIGWSLGTCFTTLRPSYATKYTQRCCLVPQKYTLSCHNSVPEGWRNVFIKIQGHRYCDDFVGYTAMREINVEGMIMINLINLDT